MSAKVVFQKIEHRQSASGHECAYTKFQIMYHDGCIAGEISVAWPRTPTVMLETKRRLRELLLDALADLEGGRLPVG